MFALESAMDELAERLKLDPIELRARNEPTEDPEQKVPYSTRQLVPCMREGARLFGWDKRNPLPGRVQDGRWLVGLGMAAASRGNPLLPSKASVALGPDGIATVRMAMTDIGTGSYTILSQIAAEMLGLRMDQIHTELGDTDFPMASGSGGSFGAGSAGSALYDACETLRAKLIAKAGFDPAGCGLRRQQARVRVGIRHARQPCGAGRDRGRGLDRTGQFPKSLLAAILRGAFRRSRRRYGHGRDPVAPHARRVHGRADPQRQDRPLAGDRGHDLRCGCGSHRAGRDGYCAPASSSTTTSPSTTSRSTRTCPASTPCSCPNSTTSRTRSKARGSANSASAGPAPRWPTPSTTRRACACRDYPLTLDKVLDGFEAQERPQRRSEILPPGAGPSRPTPSSRRRWPPARTPWRDRNSARARSIPSSKVMEEANP